MMSQVRAGAFVALIYSTAAAAATWHSPLEFVGLPAPVVFMAFAGVAFGLVLQPPKADKRLVMFALVMAYTFISAVLTVFIGSVPHMDWARKAGPAIAGLLGFFAQSSVPVMRDRLRQEIQKRGANDSSGDSP